MAKYKSVMDRFFEKVKVTKKSFLSPKGEGMGTSFVSFSNGGEYPYGWEYDEGWEIGI